jgi:hypothetical protein
VWRNLNAGCTSLGGWTKLYESCYKCATVSAVCPDNPNIGVVIELSPDAATFPNTPE